VTENINTGIMSLLGVLFMFIYKHVNSVCMLLKHLYIYDVIVLLLRYGDICS